MFTGIGINASIILIINMETLQRLTTINKSILYFYLLQLT